MKQIKDLPKDWALYLGDKSMPKWQEALDCYNVLRGVEFFGKAKYYTMETFYPDLTLYKKTLTPEEFVSHFEIEPTIEDELAAMRYEVGDIIVNDYDEAKILGVCGLVYFVSAGKECHAAHPTVFTQKELDKFKYKKKSCE